MPPVRSQTRKPTNTRTTARRTTRRAAPVAAPFVTLGARSRSARARAPAQQQPDELENEDDEDNEEPEDIIDPINDPMEVDQYANHPLLRDVINAVDRAQIIIILETQREERQRKDELHALAMQGNQAPRAGEPVVDAVQEQDYGESLLPPAARAQVKLFPQVNKKYVVQIARNTFDPSHLPKLSDPFSDDDPDTIIGLEGGQLTRKEAKGKNSAFGNNADLWNRNFNIYLGIVSIFHSPTYPHLTLTLTTFINRIVKLSKSFDWQKAVLLLALDRHRRALAEGFANLDAWTISHDDVTEYCVGQERKTTQPSPASGRDSKGGNQICRNYNKEKGCTWNDCKREHVCKQCKGGHPAFKCPVKDKDKEQ